MLRRHVANKAILAWGEGPQRKTSRGDGETSQGAWRYKVRAAVEVRWTKAEEHAWRVAQAPKCLLDEDYRAAAIETERGAAAGRVTGDLLEA